MKKLEKLCSSVLRKMIAAEAETWPPSCIGILYQPERPVCEKEDQNK